MLQSRYKTKRRNGVRPPLAPGEKAYIVLTVFRRMHESGVAGARRGVLAAIGRHADALPGARVLHMERRRFGH